MDLLYELKRKKVMVILKKIKIIISVYAMNLYEQKNW